MTAWTARLGALGIGAALALVLGCGGVVVGEDGTGGHGGGGGSGAVGGGGRSGSGGTGGAPTACTGVTPSTETICFELEIGEDSACEVELPEPPAGQVYDYDQVHI